MKLNKKGFAVSTILYALLIIFLLLIVLIFTLFDSTNGLFSKALRDITNSDGDWALATASINTGSYVSYNEGGSTKYSLPSNPESWATLPTIELPETYTQQLTSKTVINPYIPGDYNITYTIKDQNGNILPEPNNERTLTITVPEPTYPAVVDSNPGAYDGAGTSSDPYLIKSIEDLIYFSQRVAAGTTYETKYLKLVNNLDFSSNSSYIDPNTTAYGDINGVNGAEGLKTELTTGAGFSPIGNSASAFKGIFNGNFKSINHLYINRPATNNVGLFGYLETTSPKIYNLSIENANVTGYSNTAALVGYTRGEIINCNVIDSTVVGYDSTALAIGYTQSNILGVVVNGNVTGHSNVGGILGYNNSAGGIMRVVNLGGNVNCNGNTSTCYRVMGVTYISALNFNGASYSNFSSGTVRVNNVIQPVNTHSLGTNGGNISSFADINNINLLNMVYDTYIGGDNDGDGYYFDYYNDNSNTIVLKSTTTNPITFSLSGTGTSNDPYLISNYSELKQATTKLGSAYYYKLTQDIDLSNKNFYMFGTFGQDFKGLFNGDTHKLSNILIDAPVASVVGFTGKNDNKIENTVFENITVNGLSYVGGITGFNNNNSGYLSNNRIINANITANATHAGLVAGYQKGTIVSTIASGNVQGTQYVGGIAGYVNYGTTKAVINDGNVFSTSSSSDTGRVFGANSSGTLYNYGFKSDTKIKVNNVVVTSTSYTSKHGLDASAADLINQSLTIYANAGFNTTDETKYIWYIDNGVVKLRRGTNQTQ